MYKTLLFAFIMLATIACNNDNSTQNASINTNNESTVLAQQSSNTENTISSPQHNYEDGTYTWSRHDDPRIFFADFQKALKNRDQEAVYQMMNIPFKCNAILCERRRELTNEEFEERLPHLKFVQDYSIHNKKEFYEKYDFLFSKENINNLLNTKDIRTYREIMIDNDEAHLIVEYPGISHNESIECYLEYGQLLIYYNDQGMYKLQQVPYDP